ncbi:MAG: HAD family phosphatase [Erysipelotrichaceae bacterium]|nr:HAD family phosphatase [Erysipelotrichaceae bacterium]
MIKLVIFDLDGVIIDSEVKNKERLYHFLVKHNPSITFEDVCKTAGFGNRETRAYIHEVTGMDEDEGYGLYSAFKKTYQGIRNYGEILNEDAVELLEWLKTNGFQIALASSSSRKKLQVKMSEAGIESYFDYVVSAEEVINGKPDPEIFLKAAAYFDAESEECVVIEDSSVGIEAGKRAGMTVIARDSKVLPADTSAADMSFYDLREAIPYFSERKSR